jgi:hypothetical protein
MKDLILGNEPVTTGLGVVVGIILYLGQTGAKLPTTKQEWWTLVISALCFAIGRLGGYSKEAKPLAIILLCLGLTGCAGNAAVIEALAKDQATVCSKLTTIYGTVTFARTNITNGDVECDSLKVHSQGQTTIPVSVIPSSTPNPLPVTVVK